MEVAGSLGTEDGERRAEALASYKPPWKCCGLLGCLDERWRGGGAGGAGSCSPPLLRAEVLKVLLLLVVLCRCCAALLLRVVSFWFVQILATAWEVAGAVIFVLLMSL